MKLDKELVIGIIVCAIIMFGWNPFAKYMGWVKEEKAQIVQNSSPSQPANQIVNSEISKSAEKISEVEKKSEEIKESIVKIVMPLETLENKNIKLELDPVKAEISSITLKKFLDFTRTKDIVIDQKSSGVGALSFHDLSSKWNVINVKIIDKSPKNIVILRTIKNSSNQIFTIKQSWELNDDYTITNNIDLYNNRAKNSILFKDTVLNGGDVASWAMISGDKVRIPSHRLDYMTNRGDFVKLNADEDDETFYQDKDIQVKWVCAGNKYFVNILRGETPFALYRNRVNVDYADLSGDVLIIGSQINDFSLEPNTTKSFTYRLYAGPKEMALLDKFDSSAASDVMHLAWGPLDYLARFLLLFLIKLNNIIGSYGWSIIILTILVRLIMYPATLKANSSMKKMKEVQPQMQELKKKYKDNPQLLNVKMMELYKEKKINPIGGCLPILFQIPVFFALYATLDGAVELRQESFFWIKDLAAADTVAIIPLYFFNLPINPLVLAMTALMILQQRMMPAAMDAMQQKMMMLMPLVMLIFMYDMPSGLTLYWTVSNIFSILQLKLQNTINNKTKAVSA